MADQSKSSNTGLWIFAAGLLAGAALGVLYAPDKGSNTRARLTFKLKKYKEKLLALIAELNDEHKQETWTEAKADSQRVVDDAKRSAEKLLEEIEVLMNKVQSGKA